MSSSSESDIKQKIIEATIAQVESFYMLRLSDNVQQHLKAIVAEFKSGMNFEKIVISAEKMMIAVKDSKQEAKNIDLFRESKNSLFNALKELGASDDDIRSAQQKAKIVELDDINLSVPKRV